MIDALAWSLMTLGAVLAVLTGVSLLRFHDPLSRLHGAAKIGTLGLMLVIAGGALRMADAGSVTKLLLVAAFQLLTAPVLSHLIARAAIRTHDVDAPAEYLDLVPAEREQQTGEE